MKKNTIKLPWGSWYLNTELELDAPPNWDVQTLSMNGPFDFTDEDIANAFEHPIGSPRISELAKGKKTVVIATDDHTRPTPTGKLLRYITKELYAAGIKQEDITIIMSFGAHRALARPELKMKLGEDVVDNFAVYNHNCYENLVDLGTTSYGSPIHINRMYYEADLKIGVGLIVQHPIAGFGAGGKIVLPGVSGIDSLDKTHTPAADGVTGAIIDIKNKFRDEIEEIAKIAGLDVIVNAICRSSTEMAGLVVGDFIEAHRVGVERAKHIYATPCDSYGAADLAICNTYPFDLDVIQIIRALNPFAMGNAEIVREGGTIVMCSAAPEGGGFHFMSSKGGRLFRSIDDFGKVGRILSGRKVYVFSPNLSPTDVRDYVPHATLFKKWEDVVSQIQSDSGQEPLKTVVFPYGPMQIVHKVTDGVMDTEAAALQMTHA